MQEAKKTGAVIAAAGLSSRMGSFKPLLKLGAMSFVQRTVANFRQAGVHPIVLVTGHRARELERHIAGEGVLCVHNPDYAETEMLDSLRLGLGYLSAGCDRIFVSPVDTPLFRADTVRQLAETPGSVVRPTWCGRGGHPVLLDAGLLPELLSGSSEGGLAGFLRRRPELIREVPVEDEGITKDADTAEDYAALVDFHNRQLLRPDVSVTLRREGLVLNSETARLLRLIRYDGTVKEACTRLQISYRTAWNLISRIEEGSGRRLVERSAGGERGGASHLTRAGEQLLDAYDRYADHLQQVAQDCFGDYFPREDE